MICNVCGTEIPDGSKYCPMCGAQITVDHKTVSSGQSQIPPQVNNPAPQRSNPTPQVNNPTPQVNNPAPQESGKKKKGNKIGVILGIAAIVLLVAGVFCVIIGVIRKSFKTLRDHDPVTTEAVAVDENQPVKTEEPKTESMGNTEAPAEGESVGAELTLLTRPLLMDGAEQLYDPNLVPSIPEYQVSQDLNELINPQDVMYFSDEAKSLLAQNHFFVGQDWNREFFEIYETNRYNYTPNFVTVDSMMHTYHLYFAHLLRKTELNYLSNELAGVSNAMQQESIRQYQTLQGTEWEEAARRNVAFFTIGCLLQGLEIDTPDYVVEEVNTEITRIMAADGIEISTLIPDLYEDYSQYKPRGYYEGNETLENYFRAMMWYGRTHFKQENEDTDRSALLITLAMRESDLEHWESIYEVTSFFAGASDDNGYYEYTSAIDAVYGSAITVDQLVGDTAGWTLFHATTGNLNPPAIHSIPVEDGEENVILGFRFMGQRFSIDATIMQNLIYSEVGENASGNKRMLPDALDVPAALGSGRAYEILENQGETDYAGYNENMQELKDSIAGADEVIWKSSLYANWLYTLRPLLDEKGAGYPVFMQKEAWRDKELETFAGSYTELKHDTVLYSKQVMAEMGGDDPEPLDDRGYVEPEPVVFSRFAALSKKTKEGLSQFDMLDADDSENLDKLYEMASRFVTITEKELRNETCTEDEYDLIRCYGGDLEHFWYEVTKAQTDSDYISTEEYPAALCVDIATDPNGSVLEVGTGNPSNVYVIVPIDGTLRVAIGSVYSFYQFEQPLSDRLTDSQWRQKLGIELDDSGMYNRDETLKQPEWTQSYRPSVLY